MKATNWLWQHTRHTRPNDRVYKYGTISATPTGLILKDEMKKMEILLTDDEMDELEFQLSKIKRFKKTNL